FGPLRAAHAVPVCRKSARSAVDARRGCVSSPGAALGELEDSHEEDRAPEPRRCAGLDRAASVAAMTLAASATQPQEPRVEGTVYQAFQCSARDYPQHALLSILPDTAHRYGIDAGNHSYAQAAEQICTLAERYRWAGLGHGQRVGLMLEN